MSVSFNGAENADDDGRLLGLIGADCQIKQSKSIPIRKKSFNFAYTCFPIGFHR